MSTALRWGALLVGLAALGVPAAAASSPIVWMGWPEGIAGARQQQRLVLVYFHKPQCEYCDRMDRETFADAAVRAAVRACLVPVKVSSFDAKPLAVPGDARLSGAVLRRRYRITVFPTVLVLDGREPSKEIMRLPGFWSARDFLEITGYVSAGWYRTMSFGEFLERLQARTLPGRRPVQGCWTGS